MAVLLHDVRRLAEETMRICKPELQDALRGGGVPLEGLLRLLRLLQRLAASGAGRLLEPGDAVSSQALQPTLANGNPSVYMAKQSDLTACGLPFY